MKTFFILAVLWVLFCGFLGYKSGERIALAITQPVGEPTRQAIITHSKWVRTDSGWVQKEVIDTVTVKRY